MKRWLIFLGGLCGFLCALGFACVLVHYLSDGAGLQMLGLGPSSESVLLGLVPTLGFAMAALLCFAIGTGLCARAIVPPGSEKG